MYQLATSLLPRLLPRSRVVWLQKMPWSEYILFQWLFFTFGLALGVPEETRNTPLASSVLSALLHAETQLLNDDNHKILSHCTLLRFQTAVPSRC